MTEHEFTTLLRFYSEAGIVPLVGFCKDLFNIIVEQQREIVRLKESDIKTCP